MLTEQYLVIGLLVVVGAFLVRRSVTAAHAWRFHGQMMVTCPETRNCAEVKVATLRLAISELLNVGQIKLSRCSRWPDRRDCSQDCIRQLETNPCSHRARNSPRDHRSPAAR